MSDWTACDARMVFLPFIAPHLPPCHNDDLPSCREDDVEDIYKVRSKWDLLIGN